MYVRIKEQVLFCFFYISNTDGHITEDSHILINESYTNNSRETSNDTRTQCFFM